MRKRQGFTIIELIIVIAIISALAAIVLVNVNAARLRAKDSSIKSTMNSFILAAAEYYTKHGNYGAFCNDSKTEEIFDAIPTPAEKKFKYCYHDSDQWAVCAQFYLPSDGSKAWCTDSTGNSKQINEIDCENSIAFCP